MSKIKKALLILVMAMAVVAIGIFAVVLHLRREMKENFTFIGTVQESTYDKLPEVPFVEVYHDGNAVALATIEQLIEGRNPFPRSTQFALILKDYAHFGGAGFRSSRFRITLKKFVDTDGIEYWQCNAIKL